MAKKKEGEITPSHVVAIEFRDINDYSKVYKVGEDISHFDADRLIDLIEKGIAKTND